MKRYGELHLAYIDLQALSEDEAAPAWLCRISMASVGISGTQKYFDAICWMMECLAWIVYWSNGSSFDDGSSATGVHFGEVESGLL